MDLSHLTVPLVTNSFLSPWGESLTAETIRGYCPALASICKYSDCSVFNGPEIAALLKTLAVERPMWSQDPSVVLASGLVFPEGCSFRALGGID